MIVKFLIIFKDYLGLEKLEKLGNTGILFIRTQEKVLSMKGRYRKLRYCQGDAKINVMVIVSAILFMFALFVGSVNGLVLT